MVMLYSFLVSGGIVIIVLWVPSHAEIAGNKMVNWIAKLVTTSNSIVPDYVIITQLDLSKSASEVKLSFNHTAAENCNQLTGQNYK